MFYQSVSWIVQKCAWIWNTVHLIFSSPDIRDDSTHILTCHHTFRVHKKNNLISLNLFHQSFSWTVQKCAWIWNTVHLIFSSPDIGDDSTHILTCHHTFRVNKKNNLISLNMCSSYQFVKLYKNVHGFVHCTPDIQQPWHKGWQHTYSNLSSHLRS